MVNVTGVFPQKRPLRQSENEDRYEPKGDAQKHNLARRYFFGGPFHENEIASPDYSEKDESKVRSFFHVITSRVTQRLPVICHGEQPWNQGCPAMITLAI